MRFPFPSSFFAKYDLMREADHLPFFLTIRLEIFGRCLEEWFTTGQLPTTVSQTA